MLLSLSRTNRTVSALNSAENFRRFRFFVPMTLSYRTFVRFGCLRNWGRLRPDVTWSDQVRGISRTNHSR
jgi:hypothetical protein